MIRELYKYMDKVFDRECDFPEEIKDMLVEGEEIKYAFESKDLCRAVFTNRRLMVKDKGSREKIYSVPYSDVVVWASEKCADMMDKTAEITLWTPLEKIKVNLFAGADVRGIDAVIAESKL